MEPSPGRGEIPVQREKETGRRKGQCQSEKKKKKEKKKRRRCHTD